MAEESEGVGTVVVAVVTRLGLAAAKAVGGIVSGSGAMLSEAAHSVADAVSQALPSASPGRSAEPADEAHPLGYGPERYVWALLASVAASVGGAVFAVYDGIHTLVRGEEPGDPAVSYVILAAAFVLEGYWILVARRRTKPENAAALTGLLLAAGGLLGAQLTGSGVYDGVASLLIGLLLVGVAWELGRSNAGYLIGRPLPAQVRAQVREELLSVPHIEGVLELTTLVQGPAEVLIAAKIDFHDLASARQVEAACEDAEDQLRERFPAIRHVYLDPTPTPPAIPAPAPADS